MIPDLFVEKFRFCFLPILQLKYSLKFASYNAGTQGASRYFAEHIPGPEINANSTLSSTNSNQNNAYYAATYKREMYLQNNFWGS